jgi:hypothetical protein
MMDRAWRRVDLSLVNIDELRKKLESSDEIVRFADEPVLAEKVASLGLHREVGTVNDEFARFLFDADRGEVVRRESLKAEFVEWKSLFGVRIHSDDSARIEIRSRWFPETLHPTFGRNTDGTFREFFIFPRLVARIAALEGVDLVLVKTWAMNSIFGGFDPSKAYYQTNYWELENNDSLVFADLLRHHRLAFLGTHDLIAHIAGVRRSKWDSLRIQAESVYREISNYYSKAARPSIASLVLPYTIGVVLDDLAQPPTYGSSSHSMVLDALLGELRKMSVPPDSPTLLSSFPPAFSSIIEASRSSGLSREEANRFVREMVRQVQRASVLS